MQTDDFVTTAIDTPMLPQRIRANIQALIAGQLVYRSEPDYSALDEQTLADLQVESVVGGQLRGFAPSGLGKIRLDYLVTHPSLDADSIRRRQAAIRYLNANYPLHSELGVFFNQLAPYVDRSFTARFSAAVFVKQSQFGIGNSLAKILNTVRGCRRALARVDDPLLSELSRAMKAGSALASRVRRFDVVKNGGQMALVMGALADLEALYAETEYAKKVLYANDPRALTERTFKFPLVMADHDHGIINFQNAQHLELATGPNKIVSTGNSTMLSTLPAGQFAKSIVLTSSHGGVSTYLRQLGLNTILAQIGLPIATDSAVLTPVAVQTIFQEGDSASRAVSALYAQSKRVAQAIKSLNRGALTLVLADHILSEASPGERHAAEEAVFRAIHENPNSMLIFATPDRSLSALEVNLPGVSNYHVTDIGHHVEPGPATSFRAFDIMYEAGVPNVITAEAQANFESLRASDSGLGGDSCKTIFVDADKFQ